MKLIHPLILVAALIGIPIFIMRIRRKKGAHLFVNEPGILFVVLVYYTFLYTVFAPWPRYSVPLRPELYLFALWSLKNQIEYVTIRYKKQDQLE